MEYRLVRLDDSDDYVQIYDENESELLGSVIKTSRFGLARKYLMRIDENSYELNQGIFFRRKWKITPGSCIIKFKWKMLGTGVKIIQEKQTFSAKEVKRGKLTLSDDNGRTAMIIDRDALKSEEMVLVENYDRIPRDEVLASALLIIERYKLW